VQKVKLEDIKIRNHLKPGDIGYVIYLHGKLYKEEYEYGIEFESYVAAGLLEFYKDKNSEQNKVWIAEHEDSIAGFLLLTNRGESAQLRYFLIAPHYRGIGLGKKLMEMFMKFFYQCGYESCYLWTTNELTAAAYLYQKSGFKLTEEKQSERFGKLVKEQRYELKKI
jgi:GNAT superfamily N-acetyltransferase